MTNKSFLFLALAFPLAAPLLAVPVVDGNALAALLVLSLVFGGVPYLVFAIVAALALQRARSEERLMTLVHMAPVGFLAIEAVGWMGYQYFEQVRQPSLAVSWSSLLPVAFFSLLLGYGYVVLVLAARWAGCRFGLIEAST